MSKNLEEKALLAQRHQLKKTGDLLHDLIDNADEVSSASKEHRKEIDEAEVQMTELFELLGLNKEDVSEDTPSAPVLELSQEEKAAATETIRTYEELSQISEAEGWKGYQKEVKKYLIDNDLHYTPEHEEALFTECRDAVLDAIIKPFGLAKYLFNDKEGGNVTTLHNAEQGIYAKEDEKYSQDMRNKQYNYKKSADDYRNQREESKDVFTDEYTGRKIPRFGANVDHIVPLEEFHRTGGFMLSKDEKQAFARDQRNYAITDQSLNKSKNALKFDEFRSAHANGRMEDNKKFFNLDNRRVNPKYKKAKEATDEHRPTTIQKVTYYSNNIAKTGLVEAKNMGKQQAVGLVMRELVIALFDEVKDIKDHGYKKGDGDRSFFEVLNERLTRVALNVLRKWKEVIESFKDGALSGFLSNMVTTLINMFIKTGKRTVRMIREGIYSLFKAIKLLIHPPKDITLSEAAHEASKLLAVGITVTAGIALEEAVDQFIGKWTSLFPPLNTIASGLSTVIVGIVTGLATVLMIKLLDKADLFHVHQDAEYEQILSQLEML